MFNYNIRLNSVDDVRMFVQAVSPCPFEVDLISKRYVVDAKSIMGIFSLDLANELRVSIHTDEEDQRLAFEKAVKDFELKPVEAE